MPHQHQTSAMGDEQLFVIGRDYHGSSEPFFLSQVFGGEPLTFIEVLQAEALPPAESFDEFSMLLIPTGTSLFVELKPLSGSK